MAIRLNPFQTGKLIVVPSIQPIARLPNGDLVNNVALQWERMDEMRGELVREDISWPVAEAIFGKEHVAKEADRVRPSVIPTAA